MVDTALEITCSSCGNSHWYSGEKTSPETVECPECGCRNPVPEDG